MIELFDLSGDYITYLDILNEFKKDVMLIVEDGSICYSTMDSSAATMIEGRLTTPTHSPGALQLPVGEWAKLSLDSTGQIKVYKLDNKVMIRSGKSWYTYPILADPRIKVIEFRELSNYIHRFEIKTEDLIEILKVIKRAGETSKKVIIEYKDHTVDFMDSENNAGYKIEDVGDGDEPCSSLFSADLLQGILKYGKTFKIFMSIGTNHPCKLEMTNNSISLRMLIAPRIED